MKQGKLILEGPPRVLRNRLEGRVMELRGRPLRLIRRIADEDPDVEDAQMFGDRIHVRLRPGASEQVSTRLEKNIAASQGDLTSLRMVSPQLEDIFMELLVKETDD